VDPGAAPFGATVTLVGREFSDDNDVGFEVAGKVGYLNQLRSDDGMTLHVQLQEVVGVCALNRLDSGEGCPAIAITLPTGEARVFVATEGGESERLALTIEP
jgi:hypothetical protein